MSDFATNPKSSYYIFKYDFFPAAECGDHNVIKILIQKRVVDIDCRDNDGWTALHHASKHGYLDLAKLLTDNNADVNKEVTVSYGWKEKKINFKDSWKPLHLASLYGHLSVVELLLTKNAIVNTRNEKRQTPLHIALSNGHLDVVKVLLENNANVNAKDNSGLTPLLVAIKFTNELELFLFMVEKCYADIRHKSNAGQTAEDIVRSRTNQRNRIEDRETFERLVDYIQQEHQVAPISRRHTYRWLSNTWRLRQVKSRQKAYTSSTRVTTGTNRQSES